MGLSTVCVAMILLLDFILSSVPGKRCFWAASAYKVSRKKYIRLRDVNIGASLSLTERDSGHLRQPGLEQYPRAIEYEIDRLNGNHTLPFGLKLGFVILDDYNNVAKAMNDCVNFIPQTCPANKPSSGYYDVIGVVGFAFSKYAKAVCQLLGPARVPVISFYASSDSLSNKNRFPYFVRTLPPDRAQFPALSKFIAYHGWNYVSVVYSDNAYGVNGFRSLLRSFTEDGVCVAEAHRISLKPSNDSVDHVVKALVAKHRTARVVVFVVLNVDPAVAVIREAAKQVPEGTFLWIGSDGLVADYLYPVRHQFKGGITIQPRGSRVPVFEDYFRKSTLNRATDPWFQEAFERSWQCSSTGGIPKCPMDKPIGEKYSIAILESVGRLLDSVSILANAAARVLKSAACENTTHSNARDCIKGPQLLEQLLATEQEGYSGCLKLDENGDRMGSYDISQYTGDNLAGRKVAVFSSVNNELFNTQTITWEHHNLPNNGTVPESRCSKPCKPGEVRITEKEKCCWSCKACNRHEFINKNTCQACPPNTWPDRAANLTKCMRITLAMRILSSPNYIVLLVLSAIGLLLCIAVGGFFVCYGETYVVKASCRELTSMMLFAGALGYTTSLTFLATPSRLLCIVNFVMFSVSLNLVYGPLLVKTVRIYRIFRLSVSPAGGMKRKRLKLISGTYQIIFSLIILLIQILLCLFVAVEQVSTWGTHSVGTEHGITALVCDIPVPGVISFLVYNLLVLFACTTLALRTWRLPDNFNESFFIAVFLTFTLILWGCFILVYSLYQQYRVRTLSLSIALLCGHSLALIFLFLPRVYAVLVSQSETGDKNTFFFQLRKLREFGSQTSAEEKRARRLSRIRRVRARSRPIPLESLQ